MNSESSMKKILLISYFFPPDSAVGGLRIARFARHLPSFGWTPLVLTIQDRHRVRLDKERSKDLQGVTIYQTDRLPTVRDGYLLAKTILRGGKIANSSVHSHTPDLHGKPTGNEKVMQKLKRYFISLFVFLPDEDKNWVIPAALKAVSEIRSQKIDCILTSGPPHSTHLIGLLAKKITNVRWVADLRDPWVDFLPYRSALGRSALSDRIEQWMEGRVVRRADRVITTTPELKQVMEKRYAKEPGDKFVSILNGIDAEKFVSPDQPEKYAKFTIAYAGALYEGRTPEPLFEAIKKLISENKITPSQISVKLFGDCQAIDGRPTISIARSYGLDGVVEVSGTIPYSEAINTMRRSHLLLLLVPSIHHLCIPAKVYDYFGVGTRILALTEEGATAELLKATKGGEFFSPHDITGISDHIYMLMQAENKHLLTIDPARYAQFDGKLLTRQLADQLSAAAGQAGPVTCCEKEEVLR